MPFQQVMSETNGSPVNTSTAASASSSTTKSSTSSPFGPAVWKGKAKATAYLSPPPSPYRPARSTAQKGSTEEDTDDEIVEISDPEAGLRPTPEIIDLIDSDDENDDEVEYQGEAAAQRKRKLHAGHRACLALDRETICKLIGKFMNENEGLCLTSDLRANGLVTRLAQESKRVKESVKSK